MSPIEFSFRALPWNLVFGAGSFSQLGVQMRNRGLGRALVLASPRASTLVESLERQSDFTIAGRFDRAEMHVPKSCVEDAAKLAGDCKAECTVSIGGGSSTGLAKALSVLHGLPSVVVPSTYAGSEMTNIWAYTDQNGKHTQRHDAAVPALIVYDPELTLDLSPRMTALSGINAMAQAIANILQPEPDPFTLQLAMHAVSILYRALPAAVDNPRSILARSKVLEGACFAGAALGTGSTGLHHKLCHVLGGSYGTPHAETHAALLPYSIGLSQLLLPEATSRLADLLGAPDGDLTEVMLAFQQRLTDMPTLSQLGIDRFQLEEVAIGMDSYLRTSCPQASVDQVRQLLTKAL